MNLKLVKIVLSVGLFFLAACQKPDNVSEEEAYVYYKASEQNLVNYIETNGTIQPLNNVSVVAPSKGRIDKLFIEEGDKVKKGQIIAIMSSDKRVQILDMAANESYEEKQYWKKQILPTKIFSPISGTVLSIKARQGTSVSNEIARISDKKIVKANIDEVDISKIKLESEVLIGFDSDTSKEFVGRLKKIAQAAIKIRNVNVYPTEVFFNEEDIKKEGFVIRSGMSVTIKIPIEKVDNAVAIDASAVNNESNKTINVTLKDGSQRDLQLGSVFGNKVQIKSGLNPGEELRVVAFKADKAKKNSILNFIKK